LLQSTQRASRSSQPVPSFFLRRSTTLHRSATPFPSLPLGIDAATGPLNLTACVLMQIYQRQVFTWNDPKILALNPRWTIYAALHPGQDYRINIHFLDGGKSTTYAFTKWLQTVRRAERREDKKEASLDFSLT
jgi:ABC-type phosphate transport system substrate-binding protein